MSDAEGRKKGHHSPFFFFVMAYVNFGFQLHLRLSFFFQVVGSSSVFLFGQCLLSVITCHRPPYLTDCPLCVASAVDLNRLAYQEPELLSQKKSEVIQAKQTSSTGEVVNGGPLPNPPQHKPVCTFDSHNKYRGEGPVTEPAAKQLKGSRTRMFTHLPLDVATIDSEMKIQAGGNDTHCPEKPNPSFCYLFVTTFSPAPFLLLLFCFYLFI